MFEVPAAKASKGQDLFRFKIGGKSYSVKKAKHLSIGDAERLANPESATVVIDLFGKQGTAQGTAVRSLEQDQFQALVNAYMDDSKVTLGESGASES